AGGRRPACAETLAELALEQGQAEDGLQRDSADGQVPEVPQVEMGLRAEPCSWQRKRDEARGGAQERGPRITERLEQAGAREDQPGRDEVPRDDAQVGCTDADHGGIAAEGLHQQLRAPLTEE